MFFLLTSLLALSLIFLVWSQLVPERMPSWYRDQLGRVYGLAVGLSLVFCFSLMLLKYLHDQQPLTQLPDSSDQSSLLTPSTTSSTMQPSGAVSTPQAPPVQSTYSPQSAATVQSTEPLNNQ